MLSTKNCDISIKIQTIIGSLELSPVPHKKMFGKKIKIRDWKIFNDFDIPDLIGEEDIVEFCKSQKIIDNIQLVEKFKIKPKEKEINLLKSIVNANPLLNIRKRENDFLLRIKIKRKKLIKKFKNLPQAQEIRDILLYYSIANDPNFKSHLLKRNKISEANKRQI